MPVHTEHDHRRRSPPNSTNLHRHATHPGRQQTHLNLNLYLPATNVHSRRRHSVCPPSIPIFTPFPFSHPLRTPTTVTSRLPRCAPAREQPISLPRPAATIIRSDPSLPSRKTHLLCNLRLTLLLAATEDPVYCGLRFSGHRLFIFAFVIASKVTQMLLFITQRR